MAAGTLERDGRRLLWGLRWLRLCLWAERVAVGSGVGLCLGLALGLVIAAALVVQPGAVPRVWAAYAAVGCLALGALLGLASLPSLTRAARVVDHRLALDDRAGTALELLRARRKFQVSSFKFQVSGSGPVGPASNLKRETWNVELVGLQIADAAASLAAARRGWPFPLLAARRELVVAAGLALLLAGVSMLEGSGEGLLASVPRGGAAGEVAPDAASAAEAPVAGARGATAVRPPAQASGATNPRTAAVLRMIDELRQRRQMGGLEGQEAERLLAEAEAELDRQASQSRQQRPSLDRLARALAQVSAAEQAAKSIEEGDYSQAAQQIAQLGRESDQLSAEAKSQLGQSLRRAAAESSANRSLADRERRAADALAGRDYQAAQRALNELGDEVARSGNQFAGPSELGEARDRVAEAKAELGRSGASMGAGAGDLPGQAGGAESGPSMAGAGGARVGSGEGGQGGRSGSSGGQADAVAARTPDGRPGAEAGSAVQDGIGQAADPLGVAGKPFEVPVRPGAGRGERPGSAPSGEADQETDALSGADDHSASAPLYTGQAGAPSERSLVLGDRRQVVRDYFGRGSGRAAAAPAR